MVELTCGRCLREVAAEDVVESDGAGVAHVIACPFPPEGVRQRARETRETARRLVKQAHELRDRADVLTREAEVAAAALRESARQSVAEAARRMIWAKLRSRALPREATPTSLSADDGATCAGCEQPLAPSQPVVVLAATVGGARAVIPLHTACFYIWDDERSRISGGDVITE